jgi:hypothetical protein
LHDFPIFECGASTAKKALLRMLLEGIARLRETATACPAGSTMTIAQISDPSVTTEIVVPKMAALS